MPAHPRSRTVPACSALLAISALGLLAACSYTEGKPDAASQTTPPPPAVGTGGPVIGALPPITIAGNLPLAPPGAADDAAPLPPDTAAPESAAPESAAPPEDQAAPAPPAPEVTAAAAPPRTPAPTAAPTTPAATAAAPTTAKPSPPAPSGSPVILQVGSFSVRDGATRLLDELGAKGFSGFSAEGSGPFKVVRGGLTEPDARSLRDRLAAAGYDSFLVRS